MKLKFKTQAFQSDAVSAVADLFLGQEHHHATFSVTQGDQTSLLQNEFGVGNALLVGESALLANMREVQKRHRLPMTEGLAERQFCIEMETGTGKTYVYTRTIYELHKRYGFTKFIVVVPSVAIREGVYKSLEVTQEHFGAAYDNAPCRFFIYNSAKLSDVRQFATSANIEIMIINIDAFKKAENVIHQAQDKLNGETAMRYIQDTNPIVIIDEPQSVDNTPKAKEAIASLHPLCVLRYSATHREKINLLYRLTPVDAYQMGLVKQITVSSNQVSGDYNRPYIRLVSVSSETGFRARVEIDAKAKDGKVARKTVTVTPSDGDLYIKSGERELYQDYQLAGIDCAPGRESIEFTNGESLTMGTSMGDIDENVVKRAQIRRTVEAHLDKERRYMKHGIKVLSLFFIDEVKKYRQEDGALGIYAEMFEECYTELLVLSKYEELRRNFPAAASAVHDGYFSQDKKGRYKDTRGDTLDDNGTYNLIMRDKEKLLSFESPLRFIWSHSALKEGWDNPNVFQVCTLIDQKSTFTCRQKVGRGLRLCVNQLGERIEDRDINVLHVMANESFADFASTLQREIEQETGVRFGVLELSLFSGMTYTEEVKSERKVTQAEAETLQAYFEKKIPELPPELRSIAPVVEQIVERGASAEAIAEATFTETAQVEKTVSYDDAQELMEHFEQKGYVGKTGVVKDTLKAALLTGTLDLPTKFEAARERFEDIFRRVDRVPPIRDASREVTVKLRNEIMVSPEFKALWDKIKQKTAYRVDVDNAALVQSCIQKLRAMPPIPNLRVLTQTADIYIRREGITHTERGVRTIDLEEQRSSLPDVLLVFQEMCGLPLRTCRDILMGSGRLMDLARNPQMFVESCVPLIRDAIHEMEIDGIRYIKRDGEEYYLQEIFDSEELIANLDKNAVPVEHSVYDHVIYDSSTVERPFALALDDDPEVRMFFKIPSRFKIETPIGTYNPDWAVYLEKDGEKKLYFVLETKGNVSSFALRDAEKMKIQCGKAHFEALEDEVEMKVGVRWGEVKVMG